LADYKNDSCPALAPKAGFVCSQVVLPDRKRQGAKSSGVVREKFALISRFKAFDVNAGCGNCCTGNVSNRPCERGVALCLRRTRHQAFQREDTRK